MDEESGNQKVTSWKGRGASLAKRSKLVVQGTQLGPDRSIGLCKCFTKKKIFELLAWLQIPLGLEDLGTLS